MEHHSDHSAPAVIDLRPKLVGLSSDNVRAAEEGRKEEREKGGRGRVMRQRLADDPLVNFLFRKMIMM